MTVLQETSSSLPDSRDAWGLALEIANGRARPPQAITRQVASAAADLIRLPAQMTRESLERILLASQVSTALEWLEEAGVLAAVLPEMQATVQLSQETGRRHKDVWQHTKQVVAQSVPQIAVRWAALLHDMGKARTRATTAEGKVTFYRHAEVGARMFDSIARRLAFPEPLRVRVRWLILHHQRINHYDSGWTDAAVRRFDRQMGAHLEQLMLLSRADITSARQEKRDSARRQMDQLAARIASLREADRRKAPLPTGLGTAIMAHFGLRPGRRIGDLKHELERAIEAGELRAHQGSDYYLAHLGRCGSLAAPEAGPPKRD